MLKRIAGAAKGTDMGAIFQLATKLAGGSAPTFLLQWRALGQPLSKEVENLAGRMTRKDFFPGITQKLGQKHLRTRPV